LTPANGISAAATKTGLWHVRWQLG